MTDEKDNTEVEYFTELTNKDGMGIKKRMLFDRSAESADPNDPPFISPPPGSKPYYGFWLLEDISIDGFTLGVVTDFLDKDSEQGCTIGDAFVEAPDGTRAGIFWEYSEEHIFYTIEEPDDCRWGVYYITAPAPINSIDDVYDFFELILPILKNLYQRATDSTI